MKRFLCLILALAMAFGAAADALDDRYMPAK